MQHYKSAGFVPATPPPLGRLGRTLLFEIGHDWHGMSALKRMAHTLRAVEEVFTSSSDIALEYGPFSPPECDPSMIAACHETSKRLCGAWRLCVEKLPSFAALASFRSKSGSGKSKSSEI